MAKHKKGRRSKKMTVPLAVVAPIAFTALAFGQAAARGDMVTVKQGLTGMGADGKFHFEYVYPNYLPILAGVLIHKGANMAGINRTLAAAKVPFIRI